MKAIQVGNLAVVSAVSLTGVVFSSLFESIQHKRWLQFYFLGALSCFFRGDVLCLYIKIRVTYFAEGIEPRGVMNSSQSNRENFIYSNLKHYYCSPLELKTGEGSYVTDVEGKT